MLTKIEILNNYMTKDGRLNSKRINKSFITVNKAWSILLKLQVIPTCYCGEELNYNNKTKKFSTYCSVKCSNNCEIKKQKAEDTTYKKFGVKNASQSDLIKEKKANTMTCNYSVLTPLEIKAIQIKANLARHNINKFADKNDYSLYLSKVKAETNKNKKLIKNISKQSKEFHLDHKFSIRWAFELNIPVYIVANKNNLEIITEQANTSKGANCSVTLDELYNSFFNG